MILKSRTRWGHGGFRTHLLKEFADSSSRKIVQKNLIIRALGVVNSH